MKENAFDHCPYGESSGRKCQIPMVHETADAPGEAHKWQSPQIG